MTLLHIPKEEIQAITAFQKIKQVQKWLLLHKQMQVYVKEHT